MQTEKTEKLSKSNEINFEKFISDYLKYYDKNDNCINNFEKEKEKENDFNLKKEY